jgi:uncharacterized protein YecT (DUF1311 family)
MHGYQFLLVSFLFAGLLSLMALAQQSTRKAAEPADLLPSGQILTATNEEYAGHVNPCGRFSSPSRAFENCLQKAAAEADRRLNEAYRQSMSIVVASKREALRDTQRVWLQFLNTNCGFVRLIAPADTRMEQYYDCLIKMATERAKELRNRIGD